MPELCPTHKEQEQMVKQTQRNVDSLGKHMERMCVANEKLATEMREMNQTLTAHMISNNEYALRINHLEVGQETCFKLVREVKEKEVPFLKERLRDVEHATTVLRELPAEMISMYSRLKDVENIIKSMTELPKAVQDLNNWKNKFIGGVIVFSVLPSTVAFILSLYALNKLLTGGAQ